MQWFFPIVLSQSISYDGPKLIPTQVIVFRIWFTYITHLGPSVTIMRIIIVQHFQSCSKCTLP